MEGIYSTHLSTLTLSPLLNSSRADSLDLDLVLPGRLVCIITSPLDGVLGAHYSPKRYSAGLWNSLDFMSTS